MIICDIEANGLLDTVTKAHCASFFDTNVDEIVYTWIESKDDTQSLLHYLDSCPELSMHNGISYDLKLLKKLYNYEYKGKYFDTLLGSRILWPDIDGGHGIGAWGQRFGIEKPKYENWETFTPEMLIRNQEDTKIQAKLYMHIQEHVDALKMNDKRVDLDRVFRLEHKVWEIIERQVDTGWTFDIKTAFGYVDTLENMLKEIDDELIPSLPLRVIRPKNEAVTKAFKADGTITASALNWLIETNKMISTPWLFLYPSNYGGDFSKVRFEEMNLGSPTQLKDFLLAEGWEPWHYNVKKDRHNKPLKDKYNKPIITGPKLPKEEDEWQYVAKLTNNPSIKLIAQRNKVKHRLNVIKGWINNMKDDGRVYGEVNSCGTNTARMRHSVIVNVPKVSEKKFFGREMRSLFTASPGKVMIGADAKALEARIAAHYLYPLDKAEALKYVTGEIHDSNAEAWNCIRDDAKTGLYLLIFGGGAPKLAGALGRKPAEAKQLYDAFWQANPVLQELKAKAEEQFKKRKYLIGLDGRPLSIRYKHAIISSMFQSGGAIAMKTALCILDKQLKNKGIDASYLGNFHDEFQMETTPEIADKVGELQVFSVREAGKLLKLHVELDAEYKVGVNWALTH